MPQELIEAVWSGDTDAISTLIDQGADVNCQDDDGSTPLIWASKLSDIEAVKTLLAHGAVPSIKAFDGQTALLNAVFRGDIDILHLLLMSGANPNERDADGDTVLMAAVKSGIPEIVKTVLAANAEIGAADSQGKTALYWAVASHDDIEIVQHLLAAGAMLNHVTTSGFSPLMAAAYMGHYAVFRLLLLAGADAGLKNSNGETAWDIAASKGYSIITELKQRPQGRDR